ncbi:MAG: NUDIX domain-containing protein [Candidatus Buchananbacteria bacterium]
MAKSERLDLVSDDDKIIGQETRENIHKHGLLHREIHVWFYTPNGELIFQHRAKNKDTFPDLLDATVGGHVDLGDTYEQAAIREVQEETGLIISHDDLALVQLGQSHIYDQATQRYNNCFRAIYAYCYKGQLSDLKLEQGKSLGFEGYPIEKLFNLPQDEKKKFIPVLLTEVWFKVFRLIHKLKV